MWKRFGKRLGVAVLLFLLLAGCGKDIENEGENKSGQENAEQEENLSSGNTYRAKNQSLVIDGYQVGIAIFGKEEQVYLSASKGEETGLFVLRFGEGTPKRLPVEFEDNQLIEAIGLDAEENLVFGLVKYKDAASDQSMELEQIQMGRLSPDGETMKTVDVTNAFSNRTDFNIQSILCDKENNYYVCVNQQLVVLNALGDVVYETAVEEYISSLFQIKDGRIVIGYFADNGWVFREVDVEKKELVEVSSAIPFGYGNYKSGRDKDIIYTQNSDLYICNLEDEEPDRILSWLDYDVNGNMLSDFCILRDGRVVALSKESGMDTDVELIILTRGNEDAGGIGEKVVLTYGTIYLDYFTNETIIAFNKQSDKYRIEVKQYGDSAMDWETKRVLMAAEIASGKGPDMLDMMFGPSLQEYMNMGILEDLFPYLDGDKEIKREDYLDTALKYYEKEGKLYAILPRFAMRTIIGKVADVGRGESWTLEDMIQLVESKPKGMEILPNATRNSMLTTLCLLNYDRFVDKDTGKCTFTNGEFVKLLEFANCFPKEAPADANISNEMEKFRNGSLLLMTGDITSVEMYQMYEFVLGDEVNFIGYPASKGNGIIMTEKGTVVGMSVNSKYKEGVWEFIRFLLSKERQGNMDSNSFPVLKEAIEVQFAKDMATDFYKDMNGVQQKKSPSTWYIGDIEGKSKPATKEQVKRIRNMMERAQKLPGAETTEVLGVIEEEAQSYFEGEKSVEDVTALIQNRVQIYVDEITK